MYVSIIIPTYNRQDQLMVTLNALRNQTYPAASFEVILVDDGSTDDTPRFADARFPFPFAYLHKKNSGATISRNVGAGRSKGELLIFLDDDIELDPPAVEVLVRKHKLYAKTIIVGTLLPAKSEADRQSSLVSSTLSDREQNESQVDFIECFTGLLSIRANDFHALGGFHDPTGGWPNWDDVDFGYRASQAGFQILRTSEATAVHHDQAAANIISAANRWHQASKTAARLFQVHPEIQPHLPMFIDKSPINWHRDSPWLIGRKMVRPLASSRPILWGLEKLALKQESSNRDSPFLAILYRWIIGGYIFRGYRAGLREINSAPIMTKKAQGAR